MAVDPTFWRGRKVLVTGHTGFKGSWLSLWLQELSAELAGFSLPPPTDPCLFKLARVEDGMESREGDIRDAEALRAAIVETEPEVVIHMAAQPLVRRSFKEPVETYDVNVMGTVAVLESVRASESVRVLVVVTSDKCYEIRTGDPAYKEGDPKGGGDPYSSSKACAELVTAAYRSSFFSGPRATSVASVRAGNVIGGGDWAEDRLVPDIMRSALAQRPVEIRNPEAVRPWQHVLNPLSGYLLLIERMWANADHGGGWNFGPARDDEQPVRWLADRLVTLWGNDLRWETAGSADGPGETGVLRLDSSKAYRELGWSPAWGLDHGLERTVEWYKAYGAGADVREVALEQIRAFERR